jgi:hypothetical protein
MGEVGRGRGEGRLRVVAGRTAVLLVVAVAALGLPGLTGVAAAAASANLDQCANGSFDAPDDCNDANDWQNGNLNAQQAHYLEGDSVPYRMVFGGLDTTIEHTVVIEYDTMHQDRHAIDYLTSFDRTETTADPCAGVPGCDPNVFDQEAIDPDPTLPFAQDPGFFTLFGSDILSVEGPVYPGGTDEPARYTITFTTTVDNPVLAWGGHIATRADWFPEPAAVDIEGSPYHMRLIDLDGQGGNQDRSLAAAAVIFPATITIIKNALPAEGTDFGFTTTGGLLVPDTFTLDDDGDPQLSDTQVFDEITDFDTNVTVTEDDPSPGFALSSLNCVETGLGHLDNSTTNLGTRTATINLEEGEDVVCTFTNAQQNGGLTLIKAVINDDGGTAVTTDFVLSADDPNTPGVDLSGAGGANGSVPPATYDLSETTVPNYTASAWVCTGGTQDGASITVPAGQSVTCTITNDDVPARLSLDKVVVNDDGGTAQETDFLLSATSATDSLSGPGGASGPVDAGTYTLSETGPDGYAASAWVCTGGTQNGNHITIDVGQSASCVITNDDMPAILELIKKVVNDDGGTALPTAWTLTADGPGQNDESGAGGFLPRAVAAGTYALSESGGPAGYAPSGWVCTGTGVQVGASITLGLGDSATCTITNDDTRPSLTLVKKVVNDNGGAALPTAWTLKADGPTQDLSGAGGASGSVPAGTYALSESGGPAGYTASGWSCVGGTQQGASITLAVGQSAVCTITNDDQAASLTLVKKVVNDDGGTAAASAWTLKADGALQDLTGAGGASGNVPAGTYALSESGGPAGYAPSGWSCVGGTQVGTNITVAVGQSATCTITNDDQAASLTLVKKVVNDNGGTAAASAWTLKADGPAQDLTGAGGASGKVPPGTYALSESGGPAGYTASAWSCVGGTQQGANITVALGQSATCTITNDDQVVSLTLVKKVVNDHGGTAAPSAWTLKADGPVQDLTGAGGATGNLPPGTYALSESRGPAGYTASAWSCVGGTQSGTNITIAGGQSAVCTITNDDQPATLTLVKKVVNDSGGSAQASAWTLRANGTDRELTGAGGATGTLPAGTYTLSETGGPSGYTASAWSCVGGTLTGTNLTLALGQSATCTITNDDIPPPTVLPTVITKPAPIPRTGTNPIRELSLAIALIVLGLVLRGRSRTLRGDR